MRSLPWLFLALLLFLASPVGAQLRVDLLLSRPWQVARTPPASLGMSPEEVGCPGAGEMALLSDGLTVRFRDGKAVDLSSTSHALMLEGQLVCQPGEDGSTLMERLGKPAARYTKPTFIHAELLYYRGAMADLAALVQEGKVMSFLLTEPGMMEPTLLVAGYSKLP